MNFPRAQQPLVLLEPTASPTQCRVPQLPLQVQRVYVQVEWVCRCTSASEHLPHGVTNHPRRVFCYLSGLKYFRASTGQLEEIHCGVLNTNNHVPSRQFRPSTFILGCMGLKAHCFS